MMLRERRETTKAREGEVGERIGAPHDHQICVPGAQGLHSIRDRDRARRARVRVDRARTVEFELAGERITQ